MPDSSNPSSPLHLSPPDIIRWLSDKWQTSLCTTQSIYRFPQLATIGHNAPVRTVVLRAFHASPLSIQFHTDIRSAKVPQLRENPQATIHWYDPIERLQTIARTTTELHHGTNPARTAWEGLPVHGKRQYSQTDTPGAEMQAPSPRFAEDPEYGWNHFCLIVATITEIDMLHLRQEGNIRCKLTPEKAGWSRMWLAP